VSDVKLPAIIDDSVPALAKLTAALGVPREILASDEEIRRAWSQLPRLIGQIPPVVRSELHARMCIAVSTGLFDASVNYAWNSAIIALRDKVRSFGLHIVPQITGNPFDEQKLVDITDSQLLQLCLSLNLISEDAFFFLEQCRDVRNNFSAAHPPMGTLDDAEFIVFLTRCIKYALSATSNPKGVDTQALIQSVKGSSHTAEQTQQWLERIKATHEAQQGLIIIMLHGIYCDTTSTQDTRNNALAICQGFAPQLTPTTKSELIVRHSDYVADGKTDQVQLSHQFFARLELLGLLSEQERHILVTRACKKLLSVHQAYDNFYNEPPFAEHLLEIQQQSAIPDTAKTEFVSAVVTCAVGNRYGVSNAAMPAYETMIRNFAPAEIAIMLELPSTNSTVGVRYKSFTSCRSRYIHLLQLIDPKSIPVAHTTKYKTLLKG